MRMEQFNGFNKAISDSMESGIQTLHKQWGDDFDTRLEAAKHVKEQFKEKFPDQMNVLLASQANNPALAHLLSELAYSYQERGVIGQPRVEFGITPEMAVSKINAKQADPEFMKAYEQRLHPQHAEALAEMTKLYQTAYSDQ